MTHPIFISYRRSDADGSAGRLFDRLSQWFDPDVIFYDKDALDPGDAFIRRLEAQVAAARCVLVLLGPTWLAELNRRCAEEIRDVVRIELQACLARVARGDDVKVIPVLLGGARMPEGEDYAPVLRVAIAPLAGLGAHTFAGVNDDWDRQFERLLGLLEAVPGVPARRFRLPLGATQPFHTAARAPSRHFLDPDDHLGALRTLLADDPAPVSTVALHGMGGVGKTQLALNYSTRYRDAYAGVWWFRAESDDTLELDARQAFEAARVPVTVSQPAIEAFRQWLDSRSTGSLPWLLVFDNAEDTASVGRWLPRQGGHHVVITSRNPAWLRVARPLGVRAWTADEGAEFLADRMGGERAAPERAALRELSLELGGLPLALEHAAAFLEETSMPVEAYVKLAHERCDSALLLEEGRAFTDHERSVLSTLSIAFPCLQPAAAQLLRLLAHCAPEHVPEALFLGAPERLPSALQQAALEPLCWEKTLGSLRRFSLVERTSMRGLALHRMTQQVARHRLSELPADVQTLLELVAFASPEDARLPAAWPSFAVLVPHVLALEHTTRRVEVDRRRLSRLLVLHAEYLTAGPSILHTAIALAERASAMDRDDLGESHPVALRSASVLAWTLARKGELARARELLERVVEMSRKSLGDEHADTIKSMTDLAWVFLGAGEVGAAKSLQEQVLPVSRRVLGDEHPLTLASINALGSTLQSHEDLSRARLLQEAALKASQRTLGEAHPQTLALMAALARTLRAQLDAAGACALQEQLLATSRCVMGDDHRDTLIAMGELAETRSSQGDFEAAEQLQQKVLQARRTLLGECHPETLAAVAALAMTQTQLGELGAARALLLSTSDIARRSLGEAHPSTLGIDAILGYVLAVSGDLDGGEARLDQALAHNKRHGADDLRVIATTFGLAMLRSMRNDHEAAKTLYQQVVEARRRVLGDEHPDTLHAMAMLASTHVALFDFGRAVELFDTAIGAAKRSLGELHPARLFWMTSLAGALRSAGSSDRARETGEELFAIQRRKKGVSHPDTLAAAAALGEALVSMNAWDDARGLLELTLVQARDALDEEHPITLQLQEALANLSLAQGDVESAFALERRVLAVRRRVLGDTEPATVQARLVMVHLLRTRGELARSAVLGRKALAQRRQIFGDNHGMTLVAAQELGLTLAGRGEFAEALALMEPATAKMRLLLGVEHPAGLLWARQLAGVMAASGDLERAMHLLVEVQNISRRILGDDHPATLEAAHHLAAVIRHLGDADAAKAVEEAVLDASLRLFGETAPLTLAAMDELAAILRELGNGRGAKALERRSLKARRRAAGAAAS